MAGKNKINGTAYTVKGGRMKINGTGYKIARGKTKIDGTARTISFSRLPSGFQELQYAQTNGSNTCIDTEIPADWGKELRIEYSGVTYTQVEEAYLNGVINSNGTYCYYPLMTGTQWKWATTGGDSARAGSCAINTEYSITTIAKRGYQGLIVDGTTIISHDKNPANNSLTWWLFSQGNWMGRCGHVKYKEIRVYLDGVLVRHYVPATNGSAAGFYEMRTNVFKKSNSDSQPFIGGLPV